MTNAFSRFFLTNANPLIMTPEEHKILTDQFDQAKGRMNDSDFQITDGEAQREWEILKLAADAVRLNALTEQVKAVRMNFQAEQAAEERKNGAHMPAGANVQIGVRGLVIAGERIRQSGKRVVPSPISIDRDSEEVRSNVRRLFTPAMQIAAVFIVVMGLAVVIKIANTRPESIFEKNFSGYELSVTRGVDASNALEKAYREKNWGAVDIAYERTHTKTQEDYFLTAMAHMEQKDYYEAISLLKTLVQYNNSREPLFQDEADYYLAMNYLAIGESAKALVLLNKIKADPRHLFHNRVMNMSELDMRILQIK
jgi:tetratricopeptide (TPR) repeat protein